MAGGGTKKTSDSSGPSTTNTSAAGTPEHTRDLTPTQGASNINTPPATLNPEFKNQGGSEPQNVSLGPKGGGVLKDETTATSESKGFFTKIIDFFKPVSEKLTPECKEVETVFHTVKERCERIDNLYKKQSSIWELSWVEVKEEVDSIKNSIVDGLKNPQRSLLNTVFPIWYTCYKYMRDCLYDLKDLHEYIAPNIDGLVPVYDISADSLKKHSIRYNCWQMNVNLVHRMFVYMEKFLRSAIRYCLQQRGRDRVNASMRELTLDIRTLLEVPNTSGESL